MLQSPTVPYVFRLLLLDAAGNPIEALDVTYHLTRLLLVPTLRHVLAEMVHPTSDDAAFARVLPWLEECLITYTQRVIETTVLHSFTMNDERVDIGDGLSIEEVGDGRSESVGALSRDDVQSRARKRTWIAVRAGRFYAHWQHAFATC